VFHCKAKSHAAYLLFMEQVVRADADVKQIARLHAVGIVIVVLGAGLRESKERGFSGARASGDRVSIGGKHSIARETDGNLLRGGERQGRSNVRHAADDQPAVV